jgi:hypothetical protein
LEDAFARLLTNSESTFASLVDPSQTNTVVESTTVRGPRGTALNFLPAT